VPRFLAIAITAVMMMLVLPASSPALARGAASCTTAFAVPAAVGQSRVRVATLCLINQERAARGMRPLRRHGALAAAAARHSADMAARNYFAHDTMGGGRFTNRIMAARYIRPNVRWAVGENLAWGTGHLATPASIVQAWMRSPGHRANILNPSYREIGIGVAAQGPKTLYTTDFGRRH